MDVSILPLLTKYRLSIHPKFPATNQMPGNFASPYSGQGFELLSLRDYQPGDDVRRIRPGESLRTGRKIVGERMELRDVTVVVVLDCSFSMALREKWETQRRAAALLLFSAWKSESTFSLVLGNSQFMRACSGEKQFHRAYRVLYEQEAENVASCCTNDLSALCRKIRVPPRSIVFILSDFLEQASLQSIPLPLLRALSHRYDVIAVCLQDELEYSFPVLNHRVSSLFADSETARQEEVWLSPEDQALVRQMHEDRLGEIRERARKAGMSWLHISDPSMSDMYRRFSQFFDQRKGQH